MPSLHDRFWAQVARDDDGCWEWTGSWDHRSGYGQITIDNRNRRAHRVAWELTNGPIPDGLHVLHHCDNPSCVRPEHLFLGTHGENMRDSAAKGRHNQSRKTHCAKGHPYTPENTRISTYRGWTERKCRECERIRKAAKKAGEG